MPQPPTLGRALIILAVGAGFGFLPSRAGAESAKPLAVGAKVPNSHALRDLRGNGRALHSFKGNRALVLVFLGAECPLSNLYLPGLLETEKHYRPRKVQFLAVYPNEHEDLDQVAAHARDRDIPFPVLKDYGQRLSNTLGVARVPSVVVLDGGFALRYRGRVNDRYGVSFRRQKATRQDLASALDDVLAGKPVSVPETEADGCVLERAEKQPPRTDVTYAKQVARILQRRCQSCHRPDQAAPFSLLTYEDARRHARMLKEVTTQRRMPPWHADPRYGKWANNRRLTGEEIETLAAWVDAGAPRGDARDMPKPVDWVAGWNLGKPDMIIRMPHAFDVPADGTLPYQHFFVDSNFSEDRWVRTAEARPGVEGVVHHIVVYILKPGQERPGGQDGSLNILVGWAPGDLGLVCQPDTGLRVPKGSRLMFELHYTPNGKAVRDRSAVGVAFLKKPPKYELQLNSFANEAIVIPPNDPHYRAEATFRFRDDARLLSFVPHMHWRGKDYWYELIYPDGRHQTLLSVPRYDFNWQSVYQAAEPIRVPKGTRLHAVAHWDNSHNNLFNPDPNKEVHWGLQTWEEMMVGWVSFVWERPGTAERLRREKPDQADELFDRFDRNGDGFVTPEEIPERMKPFLKMAGIKLSERMTREQFKEMFATMQKQLARNRRPGKPAAGAGSAPQTPPKEAAGKSGS
jgi:mono/diheme cytochrome c family protein